MNQKLRTARNGAAFMLAILGIVCLSLGLLFTSADLSFADERESVLDEKDANGASLWLATYETVDEKGDSVVVSEPLLDGDKVTYVDNGVVKSGTAEEQCVYVAYRGRDITIKINPLYEVDGTSISELYGLGNNIYYFEGTEINSNVSNGTIGGEVNVTTYAWLTPVAGGEVVPIQKDWKIVPLSNGIRERAGDQNAVSENYLNDYTFGAVSNNIELRPEHGNTVIYSFINSETSEVVNRFAMSYNAEGTSIKYLYVEENDGELAVGTSSILMPDDLGSQTYLNYALQRLPVGKYTLQVTTPAYQDEDAAKHIHWWDNDGGEMSDNGTYYAATTVSLSFQVGARLLSNNGALAGEFSFELSQGAVNYNGNENNTPSVKLSLNGMVLAEGVDYQLYSPQKNVGLADLQISGIGSISGEVVFSDAFEIIPATNTWQTLPSIMQWAFGTFDREVHLISGYPMLLDESDDLHFAVTYDAFGTQPVIGLSDITLESGLVNESIASLLSKLPVGSYYLVASVEGGANYESIEPLTVPFTVFKGNNSWDENPSIETWIKGKYDPEVNVVAGKSHFGVANIVITDENGNVVYDSKREINKLGEIGVGMYILTASVAETADYYGLSETIVFNVFPNGLPWWAVVIIVVGSLGIVAMVFGILHEKGVLQMLTGKVIIAMRTKANVDATIAAVRANRKAREAAESIAEAKAREEAEEKAKQKK